MFAQVFHFTKLPCFPLRAAFCAAEERKETAQGLGFSARGGTGACVQTGGYVPVQMSPCGARITVTYEDGNTYSRAHRLTSLVMRLLFPSRGKLLRGKKRDDIARVRVFEGYFHESVCLTQRRRFVHEISSLCIVFTVIKYTR